MQSFVPFVAIPLFPCRANQRFHVIEIRFQRPASRCRKPIFRLRHAPFKILVARDVLAFLELARMHTEISIRRFQELFQRVERHRVVHSQRTHDAQPYRFVNKPVEIRRPALSRAGA